MVQCLYHASHEQFSPRALVALAARAEVAGFDGIFSSDHLQPWAPEQGHSGQAWVWLGAAMQATSRLRFHVISVPGGWRYHPVVLAQSIATLCDLFPGRLGWVALGSGEALNERCIGAGWPDKPERQQRLQHGFHIIKALLDGETVSSDMPPCADQARLWERPAQPPPLMVAATSEASARWAGAWADGLLTLGANLGQLQRVLQAFREGGGDGKPVQVKIDVSWAPEATQARELAHRHWRFNRLPGPQLEQLATPEAFVQATRDLSHDALDSHVLMTSSLSALQDHLLACAELGVAAIDIHQVNPLQQDFIDRFADTVLPRFRSSTC